MKLDWVALAKAAATIAVGAVLGGVGTYQATSPTPAPAKQDPVVVNCHCSIPKLPSCPTCPSLTVDGVRNRR